MTLLEAFGLRSAGDLLARTPLELAEALGVPPPEAQRLRRAAGDDLLRAQPAAVTALDLLRARGGGASPSGGGASARTGLLPLDRALGGGGLPPGMVTEVVGAPGAGKSQLLYGLAARAAARGLKVLFVDTEGKFCADRLAEVGRAAGGGAGADAGAGTRGAGGGGGAGGAGEREGPLSRVLVLRAESLPVLRACLDSLESEVIDHGVRLVLVDSVAAPVKRAFGPGEGRERQEALGLVGSRLKWLADVFRLPVAVTNHTAGTFLREAGEAGGGAEAPAGVDEAAVAAMGAGPDGAHVAAFGLRWAHSVNIRIVLETLGGRTRARVAKSPVCPPVEVEYVVSAGGLEAGSSNLRAVQLRMDPGLLDLSVALVGPGAA